MWRLGVIALVAVLVAGGGADAAADKKCTDAAGESMARLRAGDSSATNMLRLSQNLECMGRPEDALGATYFASKTETTGWTDLLIYRAYLFRSFGMEDQAKKVEAELGVEASASSNPWYFEPRPQLGGSIGWVSQSENPIRGSLTAQYQRWNSGDGSWIGSSATQGAGRLDSVFLEGVLLPISAYLGWGGYSEKSSIMGFLAWDAAITSTMDQWRSQSLSASIQGDHEFGELLAMSLSGSASRTFYPTEEGVLVWDDDLSVGQSLTLKTAPGAFTVGNVVRGTRQDVVWAWSGSQTVSWSRGFLGMVTPTVAGAFAWGKDPASSTSFEAPVVILRAKRIEPGVSVSNVVLLDTSGREVGELKQSMQQKNPQPMVARESAIEFPVAMNQDWVQGGASLGLGLGRWKGLSSRLGVGWSRTFYLKPQGGANLTLDEIYEDTSGHWVVYQDQATNELFATRSYTLSGLIPITWAKRRRDDTWTFSASLTWKALKWLSFQGTWAYSKTTSNVEEWIDGATNTRETISLGSSMSW